ncbi:hypothetical protein [Streptomyces hirsutus]
MSHHKKPPECDVPVSDHQGPVRPYVCGPHCTLHAPRPRDFRPQKETRP